MEISSVRSMNSMSNIQTLKAVSTDPGIKKIQNDIANAKQQMQKLSPKEELSDPEKETERKELKKEISSLNVKLKQHQEELRRSQQKEIRMAKQQEDQSQTKEEKADVKTLPTDNHQMLAPGTVISSNGDGTVIFKGNMNQDEKNSTGTEEKQTDATKEKGITEKEDKNANDDTSEESSLSPNKIYTIVSADSSMQQANRQGNIITSTKDGIAILKSEMNLDEKRGGDIEKKQAELEKMEKREERARAFQSAILGEVNNTMNSAAKINVTGMNDKTQIQANNNAFINAFRVSQEETQAAGERFHISIT
ncbi:MAG: hypothetical protein HDR71_15045 [Lachnospiraceae bacterium]|nr:hypothetical protein [Lachnospiraceae bacterium]